MSQLHIFKPQNKTFSVRNKLQSVEALPNGTALLHRLLTKLLTVLKNLTERLYCPRQHFLVIKHRNQADT